jgi:hypothetical protein
VQGSGDIKVNTNPRHQKRKRQKGKVNTTSTPPQIGAQSEQRHRSMKTPVMRKEWLEVQYG